MRIHILAAALCLLLIGSFAVVAQDFPPAPPRPATAPADASGAERQAALKESSHRDRVLAALNWLRDHQDIDGNWSGTTFRASNRRKDAKATGNLEFVNPGQLDGDLGWPECDVGLTGLAMMAFTAAGFDHRVGDYRSTLSMGTQYLRRMQENDGCFGPKEDDHFVYNHAFATIAVAELFRMSGDPILRPILDRACSFILRAQNPGAGWRYGVQPGQSDTSVTGLMLYALAACRAAGLEVPADKMLPDALAWLDSTTKQVDEKWQTGYDTPGGLNARLRSAINYHNNATMDAIHGAARLLWDQPEERYLRDFLERLGGAGALPRWEHLHIDMYYWYWAAKFARLDGGKLWKEWQTQTAAVLGASQRGWHVKDLEAGLPSADKLAEHGSWDPVGAWGSAGGRVYSTAMGALILQTAWRLP